MNQNSREYLQFKLDERDYANDFHARMHVYVHGEEWLRTHHPYAPGNVVNFTVNMGYKPSITPEVGRYVGPVPSGAGRFIEFNVTEMVQEWFENTRQNNYAIVVTLNKFSEKVVAANPNGGNFVRCFLVYFQSDGGRLACVCVCAHAKWELGLQKSSLYFAQKFKISK